MSLGLVLSGGGPLAVAWECGVASGLASTGVALSAADFILGTSAGAIVGAQLAAGRDARALAQAIMDEKNGVPPPGAITSYSVEAVAKLPELFARAHGGDSGRAEVGAYALTAVTAETEPTYVARTSLSIGLSEWPTRGLGIVTVDAATGGAVIADRASGASLPQAVAASCSLPGLSPPVVIGGRRCMDGGLRSSANLDLLKTCESVVVLCFTLAGPARHRVLDRAHAQVQELATAGTRVQLIIPDDASLNAIGARTMDVVRRPDVAIAAMAQGFALAPELRAFSASLVS